MSETARVPKQLKTGIEELDALLSGSGKNELFFTAAETRGVWRGRRGASNLSLLQAFEMIRQGKTTAMVSFELPDPPDDRNTP